MAINVRKDDRPYWQRRSYLGEGISNRNWIIALILMLSGGVALYKEWIWVGIALGIAGMLSLVWNEGVARTTTIIGAWIVAGTSSAWVLSLLCNAIFGMPILGYMLGLAVGLVGVMKTID